MTALCCDPAIAAEDAPCWQTCSFPRQCTLCHSHPLLPALLLRDPAGRSCRCPAILITRSPSHPASSPPLPSRSYFFGCFLPFCSPPSNPKLWLCSPAQQNRPKFTGFPRSTCPKKGWGAAIGEVLGQPRGGGNQSRAPPPRPSPSGGILRLWTNKSPQEGAGYTNTPKSDRYIPVSFPSYIPSKGGGGGWGESVSFLVASIPEGEREGKKKYRRFCDVFRNWLKQTGKCPLIKKKVDATCPSPNFPKSPHSRENKMPREGTAFHRGWRRDGAGRPALPRRGPGSVLPLRLAAPRSYRQRAPRHDHGVTGGRGAAKEGRQGRRKKEKKKNKN